MRWISIIALSMSLSVVACAGSTEVPASEEDDLTAVFASPGPDLGRTTHVIADLDGSATFAVYDRALERRAEGKVEPIANLDGGYAGLVVAKDFVAVLTSSYVPNGNKTVLHFYARAAGWKETEVDLSSDRQTFRHPITILEDESVAVGNGEDLFVVKASGAIAKLGGATSALAGGEIDKIYASGDAKHPYVVLASGATFDVDTKAKRETPLAKLETGFSPTRLFHAGTKTWITTDFEGVKVFGLDGKLLRKADLVTPKGRYITTAALLGDEILTVQQSERSKERTVLARYTVATLARTEVGTFDGVIGQLSPTKSQLFFTFSPKGAAGFNSRVYYAHALRL
ncbi:MAG: hypothetical protein JST00_20710 [Deltaproteobacteria bacterium]|nr:hypothetical protein [Deltaproteobacteria bacterium]